MSSDHLREQKTQRKRSRNGPSVYKMVDKDLSLVEMFNRFMAFKKTEGLTRITINDYYIHLRYFLEFVEADDLPNEEINLVIFKKFIAYMLDRGLSATTVNVRIRTLRALLRFCYQEGYIDERIHERFKPIKTPEDTIESLTPNEVKAILSVIDESTFAGFRNKVMLYILLDTMVRISELIKIKRSNVDLRNGLIKLEPHETKTKRMRTVPISEYSTKILKQYMKESDDFGNDILFVTYDGKTLASNTYRKILTEYAEKSGITYKRVSPHIFRHTGALFYILNGGDPFSLQKILGHSDMSMVRKYIQMAESDVKKQHNNFSPLQYVLKRFKNSQSEGS